MSQATSTLKQIGALIEMAKVRHQGPPLYLLNTHQRATWDEHQTKTSEAIETYEAEHGQHSWIIAVFNGDDPCADQQLPQDIRHLLGMNNEPITIPIGTSLHEIQQRYDDIAHPKKER